MKHLIIYFALSGTWLIAQEEADTTFIEDEDLIMEEEEADTIKIEGDEVSVEDASPAEGLAYGYKGLAWGAAMNQLEGASSDTSSGESSLNQRTVTGTLGQDTVTLIPTISLM